MIQQRYCPSCGVAIQYTVNTNYCHQCGARLAWQQHNINIEKCNTTTSEITKYDYEMLENIGKLRSSLEEDEDDQISFMKSYDTTQEDINKVIKDARNKGKYLSQYGYIDMKWPESLQDLMATYKGFDFRIYFNCRHPYALGPVYKIVVPTGIYFLNTCLLNDNELKNYWHHIDEMIHDNIRLECYSIYKYYPSYDHMVFVQQMLTKYDPSQLLSVEHCLDERY